MRDKKVEALRLRAKGFSYREIAKILGVSHVTVINWLRKPSVKKEDKLEKAYQNMEEDLKKRLKALLELASSEKGRSRVLSKRAIFRRLELDLSMLGIGSYHAFLRFLDLFIEREYGSREKLEKKRRPRKEAPKYHVPRGSVIREPAVIEIDATGYTVGDRLYTILLAVDTYSMHLFDPMVVENKTKEIKHYNKAINGYDLAKYLIHIFSAYGVPHAVKYDGDKVMNNELVSRGLRRLGVRVMRAYLPNQKVIERVFRDIKDELRYLTANVESPEQVYEKVADAVNTYNRLEHNFKHTGKAVPDEVFENIRHHYRHMNEDEIRKAFREEAERTVRNNTVQWGGLFYEVNIPMDLGRLGDYGRKKSAPRVLCTRDIENLARIEVYDINTGEYLGEGRLITKTDVLSPAEKKQAENRKKRVIRRARKITEELEAIEDSLKDIPEVPDIPGVQKKGSLEDLTSLAEAIEEEELW